MKGALALVCLLGGLSMANAANLGQSADGWNGLGQNLLQADQQLEGKWREKQTWSGWVCNGYYEYNLGLAAFLKDFDFELTDQGFLVAHARLENIHGRAQGSYRSKATACIPTSGWLGAGIAWAELVTEVHFGEREDFKDVRLRIVSTKLGKIELGKWVPGWFEEHLTGVLNRGLSVVWNSFLGNWISEKITEQARKHIPERNR